MLNRCFKTLELLATQERAGRRKGRRGQHITALAIRATGSHQNSRQRRPIGLIHAPLLSDVIPLNPAQATLVARQYLHLTIIIFRFFRPSYNKTQTGDGAIFLTNAMFLLTVSSLQGNRTADFQSSPQSTSPSPSLRLQVQVPGFNHVNVSTHQTSFRSLIPFECQNEDWQKMLISDALNLKDLIYRLVRLQLLLKFYYRTTAVQVIHSPNSKSSPFKSKS